MSSAKKGIGCLCCCSYTLLGFEPKFPQSSQIVLAVLAPWLLSHTTISLACKTVMLMLLMTFTF